MDLVFPQNVFTLKGEQKMSKNKNQNPAAKICQPKKLFYSKNNPKNTPPPQKKSFYDLRARLFSLIIKFVNLKIVTNRTHTFIS